LVKEFIDKINENFFKCKRISNYLTVDECMASFQGKIYFKQYMKMNKRKWGIKFFNICDSFTSYTYHLIPYTGKEFLYDKYKGVGPTIINKITELNLFEETHLSFDSFIQVEKVLKNLTKTISISQEFFYRIKKVFKVLTSYI